MSRRSGGAARSLSDGQISKYDIRAKPWLFGIALMATVVPFGPAFAVAKNVPGALPGYKAVPVHYGALNKMLITATVNGQSATLIVDTGARQIIFDSGSAESLGITPSRHGLRYVASTEINGQLVPLGFARNFTAGSMNFGSMPVALLDSNRGNSFSSSSGTGAARIAGVLGTDLLTRYKAVINCRTRLIFFKIDASRRLQLAKTALSQGFTRVPMLRQENGAFTVPCSINGRAGSLLVDTGAFLTTLDESALRALGIALQPTQAKARFTTGLVRKISLGDVKRLMIGDFKVPPTRLAAALLPGFALKQGYTHVDGILGLELLVFCHGIIDFDSMSLFLK
jgi:predicted aspartyl protease